MRYEFIRWPRYRIMFSHSELGPRLADFLEHGQSVYTPCLGLAWMIAWIDGSVRIEKAELVHDGNNRETFPCLVRTDDVVGEINWHNEGLYQRVRMPGEMQPDRRVTRYQEYIIETTGRKIETTLRTYWIFANGACFSAM